MLHFQHLARFGFRVSSDKYRNHVRRSSLQSPSTTPLLGAQIEIKNSTSVSKKMSTDKKTRKWTSSQWPMQPSTGLDFRKKNFRRMSGKASEVKKEQVVQDDETMAIRLTFQEYEERPCRRLTDFTLYDFEGDPQPFEMMEADDIFFSGRILPLEESSDEGIQCEGFGRILDWSISGFEEGSLAVWISTEIADYDCLKPSCGYKKFFDHFHAKATACIEVYRMLPNSSRGKMHLDKFFAGLAHAMSGMEWFSGGRSIRDFIVYHTDFIYDQLVGLDKNPINDLRFAKLPVLMALRDKSKKLADLHRSSSGISLRSLDENGNSLNSPMEEDKDSRKERVVQEDEWWHSMKQNKGSHTSTSYYNKKNYYPLPEYYTTSNEEIDEYIVLDSGINVLDNNRDLPQNMLHNWTLYDSNYRLVPLDLLPMKHCDETDVTIFGSGVMTADDGDSSHSSSDSVADDDVSGVPILLGAIKEGVIEFGPEKINSVSIRTDMGWYKLGRASKQYSPWYEKVQKTAKLGISIINMFDKQQRITRLSFRDVIKRILNLTKDDPAFISSKQEVVERYLVVHGQIILQHLSECPHMDLKKSPFLIELAKNMKEKHHILVKKRKLSKVDVQDSNPKAMKATKTCLINRIWGGYYSNYASEKSSGIRIEVEEDDSPEEEMSEEEKTQIPTSVPRQTMSHPDSTEVKWDGKSVDKLPTGGDLYKRAIVHGNEIVVGGAVLMHEDESDGFPSIYLVEYMFENFDGRKMFHGRKMQRGCLTVLENTANERELFLTNECDNFQLNEFRQSVYVDKRSVRWGHQHRKANAGAEKNDRARAEERKRKGLPTEYYCKSLYWPERGAFFALSHGSIGLGSGYCQACKWNEAEDDKERFTLDGSLISFMYGGIEYAIDDYVYVSPYCFSLERKAELFRARKNVGLKAFSICQLLEIRDPKQQKHIDANTVEVRVRRFFRPEDISSEKAYSSDIREVYYSNEIHTVPIDMIKGKCEIRKRKDLGPRDVPLILDHAFFCEYMYDSSRGYTKRLPSNVKINYSIKKNKGKCKEGPSQGNRLTSLDIFAGCGGLSEGLEQAGVTLTKWAIEYDEAAGEAFKANHPGSLVSVNNCNVILRAIMQKCGDGDDCISTPEAAELADKIDLNDLPLPGEVDFINGGPPCQGFSGMNRFNQSDWSNIQCEMILALLSFADYYRPKYFLLENVRNFVSFNRGQSFRLTIASLLEMGYQVRFGILEAGAYGIPQSRKRAFIWAASPEEVLPEWPEPMHVFNSPELKISMSKNMKYSAARSTTKGAPFRSLTVRDSIGDLPPVGNGATNESLQYQGEPISWFQRKIRGGMDTLMYHTSKKMNELNLIRCERIPKRPGVDWRDLPMEKVKLSSGGVANLVPQWLPNTAERNNQWKGLLGRLDWEGNFLTCITDPQPLGKVGMCFHPDQDRIVTVRECARSQGFSDSYKFSGTVLEKHSQVGNAVPPPLAYALGMKLKEAYESKRLT